MNIYTQQQQFRQTGTCWFLSAKFSFVQWGEKPMPIPSTGKKKRVKNKHLAQSLGMRCANMFQKGGQQQTLTVGWVSHTFVMCHDCLCHVLKFLAGEWANSRSQAKPAKLVESEPQVARNTFLLKYTAKPVTVTNAHATCFNFGETSVLLN